METVFYQGYLDSLCGIYSIVNADRLINKSSDVESQELFNYIVEYLDTRGILKDIILEGSDHRLMSTIISHIGDWKFPVRISNRKNLISVKKWWEYSKEFMEGGENRTIILSIGGKIQHLTVVERITGGTLYLKDSTWGWKTIKKSMCKLPGYAENDKYIIYPSQCWYLGKE